jgi:tetratricopeptide (TPR) repeat protein
MSLAQRGDLEAAEREFAEAAALDADYLEPRFMRGVVLVELGRASEAAAQLEAVIAKNDAIAGAHHQLGLALRMLGRTREALGQFARALAIDPSFAPAQQALAEAQTDALEPNAE